MWLSDTEPPGVDARKLRAERLGRLRAWMAKAEYGAVLLFDPFNQRYATGSRNMFGYFLRNSAALFLRAGAGPDQSPRVSAELSRQPVTCWPGSTAADLCARSAGSYRFSLMATAWSRSRRPSVLYSGREICGKGPCSTHLKKQVSGLMMSSMTELEQPLWRIASTHSCFQGKRLPQTSRLPGEDCRHGAGA